MKKYLINFLTSSIVALMSVSMLTSCSSSDDKNDDDGVSTAPITLGAGDQTVILGAKTISVANEFVAYVTKDNSVMAFHIGKTDLTVNGKKNIELTVTPKYTLYDDPVTNWGCDQAYVKSNQKQGSLSPKSTSDNLIYTDAGRSKAIMYTFENGKLKSIGAVVSTSYTKEYASYLAERYMMLPYEKENQTYFIGADALTKEQAKTVVVLQVYDYLNLIAVYVPVKDYNKTRGVSDLNELIESAKKKYKAIVW